MRFLVVGAGAVGQVYGYHLHCGGGEVGFLVKEKYAQELREKPLALESVGYFSNQPLRFRDYEVVDRLEDIGKGRWDYAIVTIPSNALREGDWLKRFLDALDGRTIVVSLASGTEDRNLLLGAGLPAERLVEGFITVMAWQAPIPGERTHPVKTLPSSATNTPIGYTRNGPLPFSGPQPLVAPLLRTLGKGGLPALNLPYFNTLFALPALATPLLVALEVEDWSLTRLARSPLLQTAVAASGEALVVTGRKLENPFIGFLRFFIWTFVLRAILLILPSLPPVDYEAFLRYHFKKVGKQTKEFLDEFTAAGTAYRLPTGNLETLAKKNQRWSARSD